MKIAIAGGGGLARLFAQHIDQTAYTFIILSRYVCTPKHHRLLNSANWSSHDLILSHMDIKCIPSIMKTKKIYSSSFAALILWFRLYQDMRNWNLSTQRLMQVSVVSYPQNLKARWTDDQETIRWILVSTTKQRWVAFDTGQNEGIAWSPQ